MGIETFLNEIHNLFKSCHWLGKWFALMGIETGINAICGGAVRLGKWFALMGIETSASCSFSFFLDKLGKWFALMGIETLFRLPVSKALFWLGKWFALMGIETYRGQQSGYRNWLLGKCLA